MTDTTAIITGTRATDTLSVGVDLRDAPDLVVNDWAHKGKTFRPARATLFYANGHLVRFTITGSVLKADGKPGARPGQRIVGDRYGETPLDRKAVDHWLRGPLASIEASGTVTAYLLTPR